MIASTGQFDCEYSLIPLRVLTRSFASTHAFVCEYSGVFSSSVLTSLDSHVGNASLSCSRSHPRLALACDFATEASRSHSFLNLKLSRTLGE